MKSKITLKLIICGLLAISFAHNIQAKEVSKQKVTKKSTKIKKSKKQSQPIIKGELYKCADNQSFYIDGIIESDNNINLYHNKQNIILSRIDTQTGVSRFTNIDKGFDLIAMPSKIMLMNTKIGRRIADECNPNTKDMQILPASHAIP